MRRHGDNRKPAVLANFALANHGGRLIAVHFRHLDVHQHQIERLLVRRGDRLAAVIGNGHLMSPLRENADCQSLIGQTILGQQDSQRTHFYRCDCCFVRRCIRFVDDSQ